MRVITDLDGTLLRGSLVLGHAIFLEKKGMINTNGVSELWLNDKKNEELIVDLAMAYQREITGMRIEELYVSEYVSSIQLKELTEVVHRLSNSNVLMITGSPDFLAKEFAVELENLLNCDITVEGSIYEIEDGFLTGNIIRPAFTGKQEIINENPSFKNSDVGLGDTLSDRPIFENCKDNILVHPSLFTVIKYLETSLELDIIK